MASATTSHGIIGQTRNVQTDSALSSTSLSFTNEASLSRHLPYKKRPRFRQSSFEEDEITQKAVKTELHLKDEDSVAASSSAFKQTDMEQPDTPAIVLEALTYYPVTESTYDGKRRDPYPTERDAMSGGRALGKRKRNSSGLAITRSSRRLSNRKQKRRIFP